MSAVAHIVPLGSSKFQYPKCQKMLLKEVNL